MDAARRGSRALPAVHAALSLPHPLPPLCACARAAPSQEPASKQPLRSLGGDVEGQTRVTCLALSPAPGRAGGSTAAPALLAIGLADGNTSVHTLSDELGTRPVRARDEARAEWRRKLKELESFVA